MSNLNSALIHLGMSTVMLLGCNVTEANPVKKNTNPRPNVIFILADDLGYGDLSCYGQTKFKTPNIDQLAASGIRFTSHYAGCTVCAPSRSSLMTGLNTGHTYIRGNKDMLPEGEEPLPDTTYTVAKMFREAGYATGAFGNGDWVDQEPKEFLKIRALMNFSGLIVRFLHTTTIRNICGTIVKRFI